LDLSVAQNLQHFPGELLQEDSSWHFIGMFWEKRFAIFEAQASLVFVNLLEAEKCIFLDQFLNDSDQTVPQLLLIPRVISVEPEQSARIDSLLETFRGMGIEIENFNKNMYKITALPRGVSEEIVLQLLQDQALTNDGKNMDREFLMKQFCSHLKFQPVSEEDVKILVRRLLQCRPRAISSADRDVFFAIDRCDLEKKFGLQLTPKHYCP
jgi:DNA mismatch repair ATPase MutL